MADERSSTPRLRRKRRSGAYLLFAALVVALGATLIWPIALAVSGGFMDAQGNFTLDYIYELNPPVDPETGEAKPAMGVLQDPLYRQGLVNSLGIAVCTTTLCLLLAMPLAVVAVRYEFPGKTLFSGLLLVPLILPPFVGAIGLRALLGRFGGVNSLLAGMGLIEADAPGIDFLGGAVGGRFWSVVIMEALHLYPIIYLNITAALANLDPTMSEAAENLGAGRWTRFRRCTLPLILPGVFAGATIVFIWSFTELGTPLMFDYYTVTPVQIFFGISEMESSPQPYALVVVMLTVALLSYAIGKLLFGRRAYEMQAKASVGAQARKLGGWGSLGAVTLFLFIIGLAVLPHIGVVITSFSEDGSWYRTILPQRWTMAHYENALQHDMATSAIANSLIYATAAMIVCVIVAVAISYLTVRVKVKGGWVLDTLAMSPLAVPGLVMAFGYVAMSLSWPFPQMNEGLLGLAGNFEPGTTPRETLTWLASLTQVTGQAPNPLVFLVVAYAVRRLPYVLRSASAGLQQTSGMLEEAALNLGASTMYSIRRVILPLIAANLIAGGVLVFSFSMLEVSDSLVLAQKQEHFPITKAIYEFYLRLGDGPYIASAMGVWGMALLTVTLIGASVFMGRTLGAIFRV